MTHTANDIIIIGTYNRRMGLRSCCHHRDMYQTADQDINIKISTELCGDGMGRGNMKLACRFGRTYANVRMQGSCLKCRPHLIRHVSSYYIKEACFGGSLNRKLVETLRLTPRAD